MCRAACNAYDIGVVDGERGCEVVYGTCVVYRPTRDSGRRVKAKPSTLDEYMAQLSTVSDTLPGVKCPLLSHISCAHG